MKAHRRFTHMKFKSNCKRVKAKCNVWGWHAWLGSLCTAQELQVRPARVLLTKTCACLVNRLLPILPECLQWDIALKM